MNYATAKFIHLYQHHPHAARDAIDRWAMQHPLFDSKHAANACGLVWDGGYKASKA